MLRALLIAAFVAIAFCAPSDLEEQLGLLSKQVTALLEKREEDLKLVEEHVKKRLEFGDLEEELRKLRSEIDILKSSSDNLIEKNDKTLVKWLTQAVKELKTEFTEVQDSINSTAILRNHQDFDSDLRILKTEVLNLNQELKSSRNKNMKLEVQIASLTQELESIKQDFRTTSENCGKTKNQFKAMQQEWMDKWRIVTEKPTLDLTVNPRHKLINHVVNLEKRTKLIGRENYLLKKRMIKMERDIKSMRSTEILKTISNDLLKNEVQNFQPNLFQLQKTIENVTVEIEENKKSISNLTKQLTNFDKLHISMLELLENVESVEAKVDKNLPDFRKEISKLEVQLAQDSSTSNLLREDLKNTRSTLKAISASVSNLQDSFKLEQQVVKDVSLQVEGLKKITKLQASKLHGHISKSEETSSNSTKSAIHLVDELETFENGYKMMINKLPKDCSQVLGPKGVYLISPDEKPVLALCDKGWTTIQKRYDGTMDFNRNWTQYVNGFGHVDGEHYLGNRNIHHLTKNNCTALKINMEDIYGNHWVANYEDFRVLSESQGFKLIVSNFSGNASNALDYQNQMEFSTKDNDRDISNTHCALNYEGGWWFSHCQHANLNGRYSLGLTWFDSTRNEWIAVSKTEMKVKVKTNCS